MSGLVTGKQGERPCVLLSHTGEAGPCTVNHFLKHKGGGISQPSPFGRLTRLR